jgi:lipid-A-disaccharide synthase
LPYLIEAAERVAATRPSQFILALPEQFNAAAEFRTFQERFSRVSIQVQEGRTWDILACSDLALAASGTVTVEACLLQTPMVTFYRVNRLSYRIGKFMVRVPFYSMVNLIAERPVVPELIQDDLSGERLASEALRLLNDPGAMEQMRSALAGVAAALRGPEDPMTVAADELEQFLKEDMVHVW